jgi:hypothetical protein
VSTSRWLTWIPKGQLIEKTADPEPPKPSKILSGGSEGATCEILPIIEPKYAASMIEMPSQDRDEVLRRCERQKGCCIHHAQAIWWSRDDGSQVCGRCHPDPFATAQERTAQSAPPLMPEGVTLLRWAPERPPVAIERWAVVNDVPQFIQTALDHLEAAMAGKDWLAGNWSVRELVDRLEQVGVKIRVAGEKANYGEQIVTGG